MPRKNRRDKRYEPREYDVNRLKDSYLEQPAKPRRKRKDKFDKKIYRQGDDA